jgi:hypothetical protein
MSAVDGQGPKYVGRGRPPTQKQPQPGGPYLHMVKPRDAPGHLSTTELRVIFAHPDEVVALLGKSPADLERTQLTMRLVNGRRVRHTLGCSKDGDLDRAAAARADPSDTLVRPLTTLRWASHAVPGRRWKPRSPALAAGRTDHLWTVKELLTPIVLPNT